MENREKWYDIPGFSKYQISDDCKVKNKEKGTCLTIRKMARTNHLIIVSLRENGKKYSNLGVARVLFSAVNGINPCEIPSNIVCTFDGKTPCIKNLKVFEKKDFLFFLHQKYLDKKKEEYMGGFYQMALILSQLAVEKDVAGLYDFIGKYKKEILFIISRHVTGEKNIQDTYDIYISYLVNGIIENRLYVVDIIKYTRKIFNRFGKHKFRVIDFDYLKKSKGGIYPYYDNIKSKMIMEDGK